MGIGLMFFGVSEPMSHFSSSLAGTAMEGRKVIAPSAQRVFWCTFEGAVAIVLLIGGGLAALQSAVISTGLPFTLVLLVMCWAIFRGLQSERTIL